MSLSPRGSREKPNLHYPDYTATVLVRNLETRAVLSVVLSSKIVPEDGQAYNFAWLHLRHTYVR